MTHRQNSPLTCPVNDKSWFHDQPVGAHVMIILPTCLDLARAEYPEEHKGHDISLADGHSLAPIFEGSQQAMSNYFCTRRGKALIDGK